MLYKIPKYILALLTWVAMAADAQSQLQLNKPNASTIPAVINVHTPAGYGSSVPLNYIRTWEALKPINTSSDITTAPWTDAKQTTVYLDGLGRPIQKVARQATPGISPKDVVLPIEYDAFGREQYKYMPYAANTSDGLFHDNPFVEQKTYLEGQYANPAEKVFYNKINYEASPLNRIEKVMAAGNSWGGNNKGNDQKYLLNTTPDQVVNWTITNNNLTYANNDVTTNIPAIAAGSYYQPGQLYKSVFLDEAGTAIVEYTDQEGNVILKKTQIGNIAADYSGYTGFLSTYYVYDDLNNLRFVIPPKAVEAIKPTWILSGNTSVINELCFRYEYDYRKRMIAKKVPGTGWVYMVYDTRDRLVFTQDANMRNKNQWMTSLFDGLNRLVMTGITTWTGSPASLQSMVTTQTTSPTIPPGTPTDLTLQGTYSNTNVASNSVTMVDGFTGQAGFSASILSEDIGSLNMEGVTVNKYPVPAGSSFVALSVIYYDTYAWTSNTYTTAYNNRLDDIGIDAAKKVNLYPESLPANASQQAMSLITGTRIRTLKDPDNLLAGDWLANVNYYDEKARLIQVQAGNHKNGQDITINRYNFIGEVIGTYFVHNHPAVGATTTRVKTVYKYDPGNRLIETLKTLNDETSKTTIIASNEYTEFGQLSKKKLGQQKDPATGNYTATPVEELNYTYNVRGWLRGINKDYVDAQTSGNGRWFGMELNYDWGFQINQLNGNISGMKWRSKGDGERRSYGFSYDATSRILGGDFAQHNGSGYVDNAAINFDMQMGDGSNASTAYDENGNIKAVKRWGLKVSSSTAIDDMQYSYHSNSNKLRAITETGTGAVEHKMGDFTDKNTSADDYGYDLNGNLITDLNKRINGNTGIDQTTGGAITYNHLNLPWQIKVKTDAGVEKGTITYTYDAVGLKLQKITEDKSISGKVITTTTDYINGLVYESKTTVGGTPGPQDNYQAKLQFISQEEGRIRYLQAEGATPATFVYDYFIKDHLGNTRMILTDEVKKMQYLASMETAARTQEEQLFANISQTAMRKIDVPGGYPVDPSPLTDPNDYVAKVSGSNNKVGPAIMLRVMSGDKVDFGVKYFYKTGGTGGDYAPVLTSVLASLAGGLVGVAGEGKGALADLSNTSTSPLLGTLNTFIPANNPNQTLKPKAYLNWIMLDEQLTYVPGSSGALPVGAANAVLSLAPGVINIPKNGYLYIYVSNEDKFWDVYFDNLTVNHEAGPMLEETHYYPFGLTMAGISAKAFGSLENKYKYNDGTELNSDLDVNLYETLYRGFDAQIGRFWQIDQLADIYHTESPYVFAFNNPVNFNDPLGLSGTPPKFSNAQEMLDYIQEHGIADFGGGITSYTFDDNGETVNVNYDPNPILGVNKKGEKGLYVHYSASYEDGYSETMRSQVMGTVVVGVRFIKADYMFERWNNYLDYLEENANLNIPGTAFGMMNLGLSTAENILYAKLPRWTGGKGWWMGENLKFNRVGWGGNQWTGSRSSAKILNGKIGIATKALGAVTTLISAYQAYNDFSHGNTKAGVIHTVDAVMGAVAFAGPIGAAVSGIYFVSRFFWGNDD